jgi:hypothetical protein
MHLPFNALFLLAKNQYKYKNATNLSFQIHVVMALWGAVVQFFDFHTELRLRKNDNPTGDFKLIMMSIPKFLEKSLPLATRDQQIQ